MLRVLSVYRVYNGQLLRAKVELLGKVKTVRMTSDRQTELKIPSFKLRTIGLNYDNQSVTFEVSQGLKVLEKITLKKGE
jgi:hypothetical protein